MDQVHANSQRKRPSAFVAADDDDELAHFVSEEMMTTPREESGNEGPDFNVTEIPCQTMETSKLPMVGISKDPCIWNCLDEGCNSNYYGAE